MDTSEQYIKMCEKAEEIQVIKNNTFVDGDCFITKHEGIGESGKMTACVWLPRQDQLQEMVGDYRFCSGYLWTHFNWDEEESPEYRHCASMEQLWLAFVMKEKYHKIWNGEDWVKES